MQNFKQFLKEAKIDFAPWQHPDSEEFKNFDPDYICSRQRDVKQNKNGSFSSNATSFIAWFTDHNGESVLPVKYATVKDFDTVATPNTGVTSLWGFPDKVKNQLSIDSSLLQTMDHLHTDAYQVFIRTPKLKEMGNSSIKCSIVKISTIGDMPLKDFVKHINVDYSVYFNIAYLYKRPLLSLLRMPGDWSYLSHYKVTNHNLDKQQIEEIESAIKIISKHLKSKDILQCQEDLIDAGLKEYAKL